MKLKRFRNKFISMLLTLAMLLTLFPTAVFAEDTAADRPASAEFKIMGLYALRDNGRRVSFFSYESRDNAFLTKANMTYPDSWFKSIYVIERSQPFTLELYEMKDEPAYMDEDIVSMPYAPEDDADGHGKLQSEEFLGRRLGVLVGVPVQENIAPLQEGDDIYTAEQVSYSPIDEDEWLNIVYQTIRGKRQPEVIEDFYAFGFEGNRLAGLDDAAATVSLDELPAPEDMAETDALLPSENLDAPNPEANLSADINDEAMDTEKSPANETSEDGASEESLTTDTESATAIEESFAPSANAELLEDDTDTAPADVDTMDSGAEETNMADVPETSIEDEPPAEKPVEAVSDVEPEEQPEINAEIDYLPESSVLPSAHAFFGLTDAAEESENTIQNIVLWDGSYRDDSGSLTRISSGGRYVIVMQPCTPRTAIYNSFLGFDVPEESEAIDTFETINSWDDLIAIRDELACSGDPVDLLSGSFTWNYRDLALYGKDDLEFTRYYESVHADENYGLGGGWTSNFSYALEFDGRSVIAHLPRAVTLYFPIGFDGSFDTCGDYSLVQTGSGYAMMDKAGTIYRFDNSGRILSIVYLSGNTLSFQYDGDKLQSVSNGAGSFTFSYSGDNIAAVTDSVGRSIHLSYDGGLLTEVENPDGDSLRYAYDGNGYLSSVQNLKGEIYVENEYDAQGRVVHQYAVNFGTFDFTYDFDGRHNTCTGEDGYFHEIWFDEQGRITKSTDASGSQTVTYNDLNQVTSRTDREGNRTSYAYDAAGNKTKITYADGTYERFEKMRIDPKPKRTKTKQYSTDEEYLASLADRHPVVNMILEYRVLKKLLSTYIEALPQLVNPVTGRVHTSFNQAVTATGRLSSTNPNLQNIPIRTEQGRQIRRAFVPSDSDHLLLSADYSQVELRLMAHLSGDEALIEAFRHGEDIHRATAARLFGIPLAEVTPEHRRKAKTANFGIIYGISAFGLKQRMGNITMEEAKRIIDGYFTAYPKVKEYMERVVAQARETGYVETIFGRRRYLPDIRSANSVVRSLAERNAINAPIQGSAADIIKIAMNRIHREFAARGIHSKVILQVHDELVIDMLREEQEEVTALVREAMEHAARLRVELVVECGVGENWLEAH